jgi:CHAT domain-containing protein/tetratricopeptide (TPR) repeat protein
MRKEWIRFGKQMLVPSLLLLTFQFSILTSLAKLPENSQTQLTAEKAAVQAFKEGEQLRLQATEGSLRKALDKYMEAVRLCRETGNHEGEAKGLFCIGLVYSLLKMNQEALKYFEQALPLLKGIDDRKAEAETLNNIGAICFSSGKKNKAIQYFNQAASLCRTLGNRQGEAQALKNIGVSYYSLSEMQTAADYLHRSVKLWRAIGDRDAEGKANDFIERIHKYYQTGLTQARSANNKTQEAITLFDIGGLYILLEEYEKAIASFKIVLSISSDNQEARLASYTLIGLSFYGLGDKEKAISYFDEAIKAVRGQDAGIQADIFQYVGSGFQGCGEYQRAIECFDKARKLLKDKSQLRQDYAKVLARLGHMYASIGEYQKGLDYVNEALLIAHNIRKRPLDIDGYWSLGIVYRYLRDYGKSIDALSKALELAIAEGDDSSIAHARLDIGKAYSEMGQSEKAIQYMTEALPLFRGLGDSLAEAYTLTYLGAVYNSLGDHQKALSYHKQAILANPAASEVVFNALSGIGKAYEDLGQKQSALDFFTKALSYNKSGNGHNWEADILYRIARLERDLGNIPEARSHAESAIKLMDSLRTTIISPEQRATYFASAHKYYEFYIDLLMMLHKQHPSEMLDASALEASERKRARVLLEMLAERRSDIRKGVDPSLLELERSLQQQLNAKAAAEFESINDIPSEHNDRALKSKLPIEQYSAGVNRDIESLLNQLEQVRAQIKAKSPQYASLVQPSPLKLREIQQTLDSDTLLIEYSLGDDHSYVWAIEQNLISSFALPGRIEIEGAARQFYELLTTPNRTARELRITAASGQIQDTVESASRLTRILLEPLASRLGKKRLVIVPDGTLQYLPFAALLDPNAIESKQPLVVNHEIVVLPSASTIAIIRSELEGRRAASKTIAVLADPVFDQDDERVKKLLVADSKQDEIRDAKDTRDIKINLKQAAVESGFSQSRIQIPRLPGTRLEAEGILTLVPATESKKALDFEANRTLATSDELKRYRFLHFATHGFLNNVHPELSGIVLSMVDAQGRPQDGFLRTHDVFNLDFSADMIVLSACETGLGKEITGEGVIGLTRAFMYAGAARVLVSLWNVDDDATKELMVHLYTDVLKEGKTPAAALRAAQVYLWKQKQWQAPYYWAAFILQGEWK